MIDLVLPDSPFNRTPFVGTATACPLARITLGLLLGVALLIASTQPLHAQEAKEERTLVFKTPRSVGTLYRVGQDNTTDESSPVGAAFGTVKVNLRQGEWLNLVLNKELFLHPAEIEQTPATGIDQLTITFMTLEDQSAGICDVIVAKAAHFTTLKALDVSKSDTTDEGIEKILPMPSVTTFVAQFDEITGKCFKNFPRQFPNLEKIRVWDTGIDMESLKYLQGCQKLKALSLRRTNLDKGGLQHVCQCKNLQLLDLASNARIDDSCVDQFLNLKHLRVLEVIDTSITLAGLRKLIPLHLDQLAVSGGKLNAKDFAELKKISKITHTSGRRTVDQDTKNIFAPLK